MDTTGLLKKNESVLEIEVANLWPNRFIGDKQLPDDGIKDEKWPEFLIQDKIEQVAGIHFPHINITQKILLC